MGSINVDENTRKELDEFKELRDKLSIRLNNEISEGIKLHDQGDYEKAIEVYDKAITEYPESASFYYEKGLSTMMMDMNDPNQKEKALDLYKQCREKDPFFFRAYQGSDPNVINKLKILLEKVAPFYTGQKRDIEGFKNFAEGCEQMELYPFAAHAYLKLTLLDAEHAVEYLDKCYDMIEKSGCEQAGILRMMFVLNRPAAQDQIESQDNEDNEESVIEDSNNVTSPN